MKIMANKSTRIPKEHNPLLIYVDGCNNKHTENKGWASVVNDQEEDLVSKYTVSEYKKH